MHSVFKVGATDLNVLPSEQRPGDIAYSFAGPLYEAQESLFIFNGPNAFLQGPLDRDYPRGYSNWQMNVVAEGPTGSKGYCTLNVMLIDINDNPPMFDPEFIYGEVQENENNSK